MSGLDELGERLPMHSAHFPDSGLLPEVDPDGIIAFFLDPILEHARKELYFDGELEHFGWDSIFFDGWTPGGEREAEEAQLAGLLDLFDIDAAPGRFADGQLVMPYLAQQVGWRLYDMDWAAGLYDIVRAQIKEAVNWYKEKGKPSVIEALFRTLGYYVTAEELWINLNTGECLGTRDLLSAVVVRIFDYAGVPLVLTERYTDNTTGLQAIVPVLPRSWTVVVDGVEWTDVRDHTTINYLGQAGPTDEVYEAALDSDGILTITFGDGTYGKEPDVTTPAQIQVSFLRDYHNELLRAWQVYYDGDLGGTGRRMTYEGAREYGQMHAAPGVGATTISGTVTTLPIIPVAGTFEVRVGLTTNGWVTFTDIHLGGLTHPTLPIGIEASDLNYATGEFMLRISGDTFVNEPFETHYGDKIKYDAKYYGRTPRLKGWVPHSRIRVTLVSKLVESAPTYATIAEKADFILRRIEDVRPIHVIFLALRLPWELQSNFSDPNPVLLPVEDGYRDWPQAASILVRPELWTEEEWDAAVVYRQDDLQRDTRFYNGDIDYDGTHHYDAARIEDEFITDMLNPYEVEDDFWSTVVNALQYNGAIQYNAPRENKTHTTTYGGNNITLVHNPVSMKSWAVTVGGAPWTQIHSLSDAGAADQVYEVTIKEGRILEEDEDGHLVRTDYGMRTVIFSFGDGVNGADPGLGTSVVITYKIPLSNVFFFDGEGTLEGVWDALVITETAVP